MGKIIETVKEFFDSLSFKYDVDDDSLSCRVSSNSGGDYQLAVVEDTTNNIVCVSLQEKIYVPCDYRRDLADYFTRCNCQLAFGHFELDMDEGKIQFRFSQLLQPETMSAEFFGTIVRCAISTMDRYRAGYMQIVYCNQTASNAYAYSQKSNPQ
ncbi:MAG: YbjN domain-containing protein [Thermoguttaceae bacterium]|nr:YbjN domain-containing protein [Thermoguttaceae bacterium]